MSEETYQPGLRGVQIVVGIPLVITIVYGFYILSYSQGNLFPEQIFVLLMTIGISALVLFMLTRVTVPTSFTENDSVDYFIDELENQEKVYVIPTIYPNCKSIIKLDRVWWEDESTPLCQECQSKLKLRITSR